MVVGHDSDPLTIPHSNVETIRAGDAGSLFAVPLLRADEPARDPDRQLCPDPELQAGLFAMWYVLADEQTRREGIAAVSMPSLQDFLPAALRGHP